MTEVKLPDPDKSSGKYTEYHFNKPYDFYYVLLNFRSIIHKHSKPNFREMSGQSRWMFRGHWRSKWPILPCAFRGVWHNKFWIEPDDPYLKNKKPTTTFTKENKFGDQIKTECRILRQFMETANSLGIECNYTPFLYEYERKLHEADENKDVDYLKKWPDDKILSLMALAQHHGLPTRLLDFTYNPLFAIFFAASNPFEEYLKGTIKIDEDEDEEDDDEDKNLCVWAIKRKTPHNKPLREVPAVNDRSSNLFAQEGLLILDHNANDTYTKHYTGWQKLQDMGNPTHFIKLTLPQKKYAALLVLLLRHNITPAKIMPNLDRVTGTLEYTQWLWAEKGYSSS